MAVLNKRADDIKNGLDGGGDYQESLKSVGGKVYTPPKDNSSYYEALKNESYSTLLQSEIQASIARDQAMKYTQGQLNAQGYGTQGLSESSNIGAYNNYMGALNNAQSDYRNSLLGIKQQEQNAKEEQFQQLATLMGGAESTENLGRLFDAYGITVDENGNLGGDYFNSLDPQSQAQLKYLYDSYNKSYGTAENEEKQQAFIEKYAVADYIGSGIEAGTPIIAGAIGLAEACKYLDNIGLDNIAKYEYELKTFAISKLKEIEGVNIYNETAETGIISFNLEGIHPHDAASVFDNHKVCIIAGHHCAQLITAWLKTIGTIRASFYFYNTKDDVLKFIEGVKDAIKFFGSF